MPNAAIGSIVAFAGPGPGAPEWENKMGWLLCDGRQLDRTITINKPLFDAIGSSWGGDGVNKFNVPDLRGLFLRGVDSGSQHDPDRDSRTAMKPGGHSGDNVATFQPDGFASHTHTATGIVRDHPFSSTPVGASEWPGGFGGGGLFGDGGQGGVSRHPLSVALTVDPRGVTETRPENASVFWIIKFKD